MRAGQFLRKELTSKVENSGSSKRKITIDLIDFVKATGKLLHEEYEYKNLKHVSWHAGEVEDCFSSDNGILNRNDRHS